jgi:multicomponent K+:H+ antiporter subunit G
MNEAGEVSTLAALFTALFLTAGATLTLIGSLGLLRLRTFYERAHGPTLGTTLGTACIATASMIYFSALASRPVLHEVLIVAFITITTPISLVVLVRAAVSRDEFEAQGALPPGAKEESR